MLQMLISMSCWDLVAVSHCNRMPTHVHVLKTLRSATLCWKASAACLSLLSQALLLIWPGPAPLQASQLTTTHNNTQTHNRQSITDNNNKMRAESWQGGGSEYVPNAASEAFASQKEALKPDKEALSDLPVISLEVNCACCRM